MHYMEFYLTLNKYDYSARIKIKPFHHEFLIHSLLYRDFLLQRSLAAMYN